MGKIAVHDILEALGLKTPILLGGLLGGIFRAFSRSKLKMREIVFSPICGALAAGYLTESVVHYLRAFGFSVHPTDQVATNTAAFVIGICGMWVADIVLNAVVRYFKPDEG